MRVVESVGFALFAGNVLLIVTLVLRRARRARQERRRDEVVVELRQAAVAFVDGDAVVPSYRGREAEVFAEILGGYARVLRGASRERIRTYFEASGGVDAQCARLRSRRAWKRATAAFTLGDMSSPTASAALIGALDDRDREVRMAAARSLGRLGALDAIEPLLQSGINGRVPRDVIMLALFDLGPDAVPRLTEVSANDNPPVRAAALELVGLIGAAGDARPVLEHLSDPAAEVRTASATALGRLGAGEARDTLIGALDDRVLAVRCAAAQALGQIGGQAAAEALLPVAREDAFEPARAAAEALARIDPQRVLAAGDDPDAGPYLHEAADLLRL